MPYIKIQVTNEKVSTKKKKELIKGATDLLVSVLNKDPSTTFVIIEEVSTDNWGISGKTVTDLRKQKKARR